MLFMLVLSALFGTGACIRQLPQPQSCTFVRAHPYANGVYRVTRTALDVLDPRSCVESTNELRDAYECCTTGLIYPSCSFIQKKSELELDTWFEDVSVKTKAHTACALLPKPDGCFWILRKGYSGYVAVVVPADTSKNVQGGLGYEWVASCESHGRDRFGSINFSCANKPSPQYEPQRAPPKFEQVPFSVNIETDGAVGIYNGGVYCFQI